MTETPPKPIEYTGRPSDGWVTDEARLLAGISDQLAAIQGTLDRLELGAAEFVPALRSMMGRRMTKAAASAAELFRRDR